MFPSSPRTGASPIFSAFLFSAMTDGTLRIVRQNESFLPYVASINYSVSVVTKKTKNLKEKTVFQNEEMDLLL